MNDAEMKQINWGIIGCGNVTEAKSGPAFGKVEGSRVIAVMRRDAGKAADYARRHGIPAWYSDADDLIHDPEVNAVYIATPPSSHADYAIRVMESGKPAYVEKPMASDYHACLEMNQVSKQTGMPLYVAYYRRYLPYFIKVKEIIDSGQLGGLLLAEAVLHLPARPEDVSGEALPWRVDAAVAGGGYFYDLACHQIDLFEWFFGNVKSAKGTKQNRGGLYDAEDTVVATLAYESGFTLTGNWCFVANERFQQDIIKVYGTRGVLEFSTFAFTPMILRSVDGESSFNPPNPANIQYGFIRNMVEELQGMRPLTCNGACAARTNRIMDHILGKK
jgi:predicted dehydrogenase